MISAANATDLLSQANTQGTQGWELVGVAVTPVAQTNISDSSNVRSSSRSGMCSKGNGSSIGPTFKTNANPGIGPRKLFQQLTSPL